MDFISEDIENVKSEAEFEEEVMDIETELDACCEDGEINSDDEKNPKNEISDGKHNIFTTNQPADLSTKSVFNEDGLLKKLDRARRFSIPVNNIEVAEVHEDQLLSLYTDLGINKENQRHYRFNTIHMRGTENMSTKDVLQYFAPFSPSYVEWINDFSCNVVWMDDIATARAFLNLSRRIKNLDKVHSNADPFEKDFRNDSPDEVSDDDDDEDDDDDSFDARSIRTAIPPGYWRLGVPCKKGQYLLLRYATRSDKKQKNAEKNSTYYRKYGNPHFGNIPGLISNSLRTQVRKKRFRLLDGIWESKKDESGKKNPWEDLAYEWGESDKGKDDNYDSTRNRNLGSERVKPYISDLRISLLNRKAWAKRLRPVSDTSPNSSDKESWEIRSKIPRMKMYADDEEINSEKSLSLISHSRFKAKPVEDLRDKINLRKKEGIPKFRTRKRQFGHYNELSGSENEYDDGDSSEWALEQYHDLRESLRQHKKSERQRHKFVKYESESEEELSDSFEERDLSCRSPLQVEIENNECYLNEK